MLKGGYTRMAKIKKSDGKLINVEKKIFNGTEIIEIREYVMDDSGNIIPTRKGINISSKYLKDLIRELAQISDRENSTISKKTKEVRYDRKATGKKIQG